MSQNRETVARYLDGFRASDHAMVLSCMTDDVEWIIPGAFHVTGKEAFDREIENDALAAGAAGDGHRLDRHGVRDGAGGHVRANAPVGSRDRADRRDRVPGGIAGALAAFAWVVSGSMTAPSRRRWVSLVLFAFGAWAAYALLWDWDFPENDPRGYQISHLPFYLTLIGGAAGVAAMWLAGHHGRVPPPTLHPVETEAR